MTTRIHRGDAAAVAQVVTVTPGDVVTGRTYGVRINGKDVTVTATSTDEATLITLLASAISGSAVPEFKEVTPADSSGVLTLTSKTAGVPFSVEPLAGGFVMNSALVVTIRNSPTGGTWSFVPHVDDGVAASIAYNASAATVQGEMDTIYGSGNTLVTLDITDDGRVYTIEMIGTRANAAVPSVTVSYSSLTGGDAAVEISTIQTAIAGTDEVQTVTLRGSPSGGTFTLSFRGATTTALAYNASTATVQTALRALTTIGATGCSVGGSAGAWVVTFAGPLAHLAVEALEIDCTLLTGGTIFAAVATVTDGASAINQIDYLYYYSFADQQASISITKATFGSWSAGSWTLTINGDTSGAIPYDATDAEIAAILETLLESAGVIVTSGFSWIHINFVGPLYDMTLSTVTRTTSITGGSVAVGSFTTGVDNADPNNVETTYKFSLDAGGSYSAAFVQNASAATIQGIIEDMADCGAGNVEVTLLEGVSLFSQAGLIKIEFIGALAGTFLELTVHYAGGTVDTVGVLGCDVYQEGVPSGAMEVQTLTVSGSPSTGTITLIFNGHETAAIAYNATANDVENALLALPNLAPGDIVATGGPLSTMAVTLTFGGAYSYTDVAEIIVEDSYIKATVAETTPGVTGQNEITRLSLVDQEVWGGTTTLTWSGQTTSALDHDSTASEVEAALIALSNIAAGEVSGTGGPWPDVAIDIEWTGGMAETDVALMTATSSLKNGLAELDSIDAMILVITTAASGPNHWSDATNWANPDDPTDIALPQPGDDIVFVDTDVDVLYGLVQRVEFTASLTDDYLVPAAEHDLQEDQGVHVWSTTTLPTGLSASTMYYVRDLDRAAGKFRLATSIGGAKINLSGAGSGTHQVGLRVGTLKTYSRSSSQIGLPRFSDAGYWEYRTTYLTIGVLPGGTKTITIGQGEGSGSERINIDTGTDQVVLEVLNSSSGPQTAVPAVCWKGVNGSTTIEVNGGQVGLAALVGETATVGPIKQTAGELAIGIISNTTFDKRGGTITFINGMTSSGLTQIRQ